MVTRGTLCIVAVAFLLCAHTIVRSMTGVSRHRRRGTAAESAPAVLHLRDDNDPAAGPVDAKGPHTDGTYLVNAPRVKMWGCVHYDGGAPYPHITFHHLRRAATELAPKERKLLASSEIGFRLDVGSDVLARHTTLAAERAVWNAFTHSIAGPPDADAATEAALKKMAAQLERPALHVNVELKPGVVVLVDNSNQRWLSKTVWKDIGIRHGVRIAVFGLFL